MLTQLETVFIFAVLLPAIVTVIVFATFMICWFKCDLREKLLQKCSFKKRQNSSASNSTANTVTNGRIHYIKDSLDTNSSRGRHPSGGSSTHSDRTTIHIDNEGRVVYGANHSNMGFEIEDEGPIVNDCDIETKGYSFPGVKVKLSDLPALAILHEKNNPTSAAQYLPSTSKCNISPKSNNSQTNREKTYSEHNMSQSPIITQGETSNYRNNTDQKSVIPCGSRQSNRHIDIPSVHIKPQNLRSSNQRRSNILQNLDLSHNGHHTRRLTSGPHSAVSLDNSTSSYSSSNEGEYNDRDLEYTHFIPASQLKIASKKPKYISGLNSENRTDNIVFGKGGVKKQTKYGGETVEKQTQSKNIVKYIINESANVEEIV